jgi:hypothetical protein
MKTFTFDNSDAAKRAILELLGKSVDDEGYIIEIKTGERVVSPTNQEVALSNFAGIRKGSEIFITNDLPALLEQAEYIED